MLRNMEWYTKFLRILLAYRFFLALLAQAFFLHPCYQSSRKSQLIRLTLMPVTIWLAISSLQHRRFEPLDEFFHLNFPLVSFPTFHSIFLAIEFGLHKGPVLKSSRGKEKKDEKESETESLRKHYDDIPGRVKETPSSPSAESKFPSFGERIKFLVWLIFSPRGLQTAWAPPTSVVPVGGKTSIGKFLMFTAFKALVEHFLFTFFWAIATSFAQSPTGIYGYLTQELGVPDFTMLKEMAPFLICFPISACAIILIDFLGCMFNILEVAVYLVGPKWLPSNLAPGKWDSTLYPPLFNEPWTADSLIVFWSRAWHTIFRQHILFCGYKPVAGLFKPFGKEKSRIAGLMGAMVFSGLFHEFVLATVSSLDPNLPTFLFFVANGIGMAAEMVFKKTTGRKVGGILGQVWFCTFLLILGRPAIESWIERGLGRSGIPPVAEWSRLRLSVPFGPWLPEKIWLSISFWVSSLIYLILSGAILFENLPQ